MRSAERRSNGAFRIIKSGKHLDAYARERQDCIKEALAGPPGTRCNITAGILGVEGAHGLGGKIARMEELHALGCASPQTPSRRCDFFESCTVWFALSAGLLEWQFCCDAHGEREQSLTVRADSNTQM